MTAEPEIVQQTTCFHCGQPCDEITLLADDKSFCCTGCRTVYEILAQNNLCEYYDWTRNPGQTQRFVQEESYAFMDEGEIRKRLLSFDSEKFAKISLFVPAIHCMSCHWLLENLQRLNPGVIRSEVNFGRKRVEVDFNPAEISPAALARLMASLGYPPSVSLEEENKPLVSPSTRRLVIRLAIAGFCFGNIMLLSFPEYLGVDGGDETLRRLFSWLNLLLAIPVTVYSASDYFTSAWKTFRQKQINIDVPIAIGLAALFLRSAYDIISNTGAGYLDSLAGLVFFLLIGRWFQSKTYDSLAFDRDYRSYFPLAVQRQSGDTWKPVLVYDLAEGDIIRVRNMEVVPADSILMEEVSYIDYSFVTGESRPVEVKEGDFVYAGGRMVGAPAKLTVRKKTSQSHLTSLWNQDPFQKAAESRYRKIIDRAARRFTWVVLALAILTGIYWQLADPSRLWLIITSVLMVACPCALALAAPFTFGSMMRAFGRLGLYLKNADIIERMAVVDTIVFDKTGTVTYGASDIRFTGALDDHELDWVYTLTSSSSHPLSHLITKSLRGHKQVSVSDFSEIPGKGIEGTFNRCDVRVGSAAWVGLQAPESETRSNVYVSVDGMVRGYFRIDTTIRPEMEKLMPELKGYSVALLSGDNANDMGRMIKLFPLDAEMKFEQNPHDKMAFISSLQARGHRVMMVGDGLNDAGALKQSDVGVAVTDDTGVFTPSCDAIITGQRLGDLTKLLALSRKTVTILKVGFGISFFYNIIALSIAMSGYLSPLVAAILMPVSSISVVGFSTIAVRMVSRRIVQHVNPES